MSGIFYFKVNAFRFDIIFSCYSCKIRKMTYCCYRYLSLSSMTKCERVFFCSSLARLTDKQNQRTVFDRKFLLQFSHTFTLNGTSNAAICVRVWLNCSSTGILSILWKLRKSILYTIQGSTDALKRNNKRTIELKSRNNTLYNHMTLISLQHVMF
jgi:hypothetical protein